MLQFWVEFFLCAFCLYFFGVTSKGMHKIVADFFKGRFSSWGAFKKTLKGLFRSYGLIMDPTPKPAGIKPSIWFVLGPYLCFFQIVFVLMFMPIGYEFSFVKEGTSILWIFFLIVFGNLLTLIIAYNTRSLPVLFKMPQFLVSFCGSLLMLYLILKTIILWCGSISLTWVVSDQKNMWNIIPLFPLFLIYLVFVLHFCHKKPFGSLKGHVFPVEKYRMHYTGGLDWLLQIAEESCYIVLCGLGVILFAGGGLPLSSHIALSPLSWFSLKTALIVIALSALSARFQNLTHAQVLDLMLKIILPASIFLFFVYLSIKTLIL